MASRLATRVSAAYADSTCNAEDLVRLGVEDVEVVPPLLDPFRLGDLPGHPEFLVEMAHRAPAELVLFVGQLLPHKRPDLLIAAHHLLTAHHRPDAALVIVGTPRFPRYFRQLANFASSLNLPRVWFTGPISDRRLAELYRRADVFVTASAHEGFCVPITEAMAASVPVVATDAGAIAETMGGAGLLLPDASPATIAEAVDLVIGSDTGASMAVRGRARARELSLDAATARLDAFLDAHL
jgi:glycosyltransferase involved in cell wall biosynthesis